MKKKFLQSICIILALGLTACGSSKNDVGNQISQETVVETQISESSTESFADSETQEATEAPTELLVEEPEGFLSKYPASSRGYNISEIQYDAFPFANMHDSRPNRGAVSHGSEVTIFGHILEIYNGHYVILTLSKIYDIRIPSTLEIPEEAVEGAWVAVTLQANKIYKPENLGQDTSFREVTDILAMYTRDDLYDNIEDSELNEQIMATYKEYIARYETFDLADYMVSDTVVRTLQGDVDITDYSTVSFFSELYGGIQKNNALTKDSFLYLGALEDGIFLFARNNDVFIVKYPHIDFCNYYKNTNYALTSPSYIHLFGTIGEPESEYGPIKIYFVPTNKFSIFSDLKIGLTEEYRNLEEYKTFIEKFE